VVCGAVCVIESFSVLCDTHTNYLIHFCKILQAHLNQGGVEMEGYLYKKGRGRTISFVKPWSYRYFKLNTDTGTLRYYADNNGC
jgi:hypothetical protein